jgi:hypothetical protein
MKRYVPFIVALLIGVVALGFTFTQSQRSTASRSRLPLPPSYPFEEAEKLAQAELALWVPSLQISYQDYGFKSEDETKRATLGKPYISYGFDIQAMADQNYRSQPFRATLEGGVNIEFPVLVDGEPRTTLTIGYRNQRWQSTSNGGYWPGRIVGLQERLAKQGITGRVDLIAFGIGWSEFGLVEHDGQTFLILLQDVGGHFQSLDLTGDRMYPLDEVLPIIHAESKVLVDQFAKQDEFARDLMKRITPPPVEDLPTDEPLPPSPLPVAPIAPSPVVTQSTDRLNTSLTITPTAITDPKPYVEGTLTPTPQP